MSWVKVEDKYYYCKGQMRKNTSYVHHLRDVHIIKWFRDEKRNREGGCLSIGSYQLKFPKELIGKRVRIAIEIVKEVDKWDVCFTR